MSKIKKKSKRETLLSKEEMIFEKIMQFCAWIFLAALVLFMGAWVIFDYLLDFINFDLAAPTYTFIIFTGLNAAISFATATRIKNNRDQKKKLYLDWLLGEFFISMFAIFAIAAYQW
ncbi:MAG: hypothetical protein ACFFD5_01550 [Candidatus Thorarchaeota archaeon]